MSRSEANAAARRDRALVVGCGQIGVAVARALAATHEVSVHCRRAESVRAATEELGLPAERAWFGDLTATGPPPTRLSDAGAPDAPDGESVEDRLTRLVSAVRPAVVVDATNLATSNADPLIADPAGGGAPGTPAARLAGAGDLVRRRAVELHRLLRGGAIRHYLRVSTTGLGSRGLELPFTHGDAGDVMSPALWHKVLFAGMEHQVLWALARSFPGSVSLVIPAAFVGFENFATLTARAADDKPPEDDRVAAGEDRSYTPEELALLSSVHQMGAVTREDVAATVRDVVLGRDRSHDLLAAMSTASLTASVAGHRARDFVLDWLRAQGGGDAPVAAGALGGRVSRALHLLRLLRTRTPERLWPPQPVELRPATEEFEAALRSAEDAGVPLRTDHPADPSAPGGPAEPGRCVCDDCLLALRAQVSTRLAAWYGEATDADRVALLDTAGRDDWFEGDVLAVLWQGAGAEDDLL